VRTGISKTDALSWRKVLTRSLLELPVGVSESLTGRQTLYGPTIFSSAGLDLRGDFDGVRQFFDTGAILGIAISKVSSRIKGSRNTLLCSRQTTEGSSNHQNSDA
jgi:hypothetical protein